MNPFICPYCDKPLIAGGAFDFDDYGRPGEGLVLNYTCSNCPIYVELSVYDPEEFTPGEWLEAKDQDRKET